MSSAHLRIVHLYPFGLRGAGGVAASFVAWAEGLAEAGADVVAITGGGIPPSDTGVEWVSLDLRPRAGMRIPFGLKRVLRNGDALVLHSAWSETNALAARVARRARIPYVIVPHGAYDPRVVARRGLLRRAWFLGIERPLLRDAAAVHVFFEEEIEYLSRMGYRGRTIVAPNGVVPPPVDRRDRDGHVLWWGRLDIEHKGLDLLVHAMTRLPEVNLVIHGVGPPQERAALQNLIDSTGNGEHVRLLPPVTGNAKWQAMARATAFAFPSRWDAHSIAVMEAAAAGIPVVATNATFIARELAARNAAILVAPDEASIADGIRRALTNEGDDVARIARRVAREEFAPKVVAKRFLEQLSGPR